MLHVLPVSWTCLLGIPAATAPEHQSLWSCDISSLPLVSPTAAAMPGPTKDKHRHSWQNKSVLVLMGILEVRWKCQVSAWHVMMEDSKWKKHVHQNTRQEGGCKMAPSNRYIAATWMNQVVHSFLAKLDTYAQC